MRGLWDKDAIIYCLDVDTYKDASGDGIGDFKDLTKQLDYITGLGINCLWLLPFYPTLDRDNGRPSAPPAIGLQPDVHPARDTSAVVR